MIIIKAEHCTGCGACLEVCPTAAIYLVDGKAVVDGALCQSCEACLVVCPMEAIIPADPAQNSKKDPVRVPAPQPEPEIVRFETQAAPTPLRAKALPVVGAALAWAGRELVPWLAEYFLHDLDQRVAKSQARRVGQGRAKQDFQARGGGRQRRRQRRGGGRSKQA